MSSFSERYENIDWEQIRLDRYKEEKENPNNYSYWYPKVKDCGIPMVISRIYQIPLHIWKSFMEMENKENREQCAEWIFNTIVKDETVQENVRYNIKNGCFSNKFNAEDCNVEYNKLVEGFLNIQYMSQCYDTGGTTELVVRDYLPFNHQTTPTIYNGLPLRPEFRVFVDFDTNEILYIVNYWDYDYCSKGMYDKTDKIVFDYMREELDRNYHKHANTVVQLIRDKLLPYNTQQNNKLTGKWSVDIMLWENSYFLIDMAIAHRSAYWDKNRKDY